MKLVPNGPWPLRVAVRMLWIVVWIVAIVATIAGMVLGYMLAAEELAAWFGVQPDTVKALGIGILAVFIIAVMIDADLPAPM